MATVTVEVNGRPYAVGCADGQEERVRILAKQFDGHVRQVAGELGRTGVHAEERGVESLGARLANEPFVHADAAVTELAGVYQDPC